jgi:hypothetical protein
MTPEQWEAQLLGYGLFFLLMALLVSGWVWMEWRVSKPAREARKIRRIR